ncbi:MAG: DNA-3-methyladenine glycosylase I [Pseudomonadota bacterium]|nr:DNA-3-methyladenine glycosylase I [Pseudomonadota bacterium]
MITFSEVEDRVIEAHGSVEHLPYELAKPLTRQDILSLDDEVFLSALSKVVFQVGFNWSVIEKKWPDFERHFFGFNLNRCAMISDEELESIMATGETMKHWKKMSSVVNNAQWLKQRRDEHGSLGAFFGAIKPDAYFENVVQLQKQGDRTGAKTVQLWLRRIGVDSVVLSQDVVDALLRYGVVDKPPSSVTSLRALQAPFDQWREETGESLTYLSQMLAFSLGPKR